MSNKKQLNARRTAERRKRRLESKLQRSKELQEKRALQLTLEIKKNIIQQVMQPTTSTFNRGGWKGQVVAKNTKHIEPADAVLKQVGFDKAGWRQKVETNAKDS